MASAKRTKNARVFHPCTYLSTFFTRKFHVSLSVKGLPRLTSVSKKNHEEMTQLAFTLLQERYYSSRRQASAENTLFVHGVGCCSDRAHSRTYRCALLGAVMSGYLWCMVSTRLMYPRFQNFLGTCLSTVAPSAPLRRMLTVHAMRSCNVFVVV